MLSQNFLFFFAMLGAFNGIGVASFLWWRAKGKPTQRWLSLLLLMVSVRTGKSVAFHFWPDIPQIVLQLGLTACFMIGPCLFFLVRSTQGDTSGLGRADRWHIAVLLALIIAVNVFLPYVAHPDLWRQVITPAINYAWLVYLLLATAQVYLQRTRLAGTPSGPLLLGALAGIWIIWIAYYTAGYTSYIVGALSFTFVLAASVLVYLRLRSGQAPIEPYQDRRIPESEAAAQLQALAALMANERLYLDPRPDPAPARPPAGHAADPAVAVAQRQQPDLVQAVPGATARNRGQGAAAADPAQAAGNRGRRSRLPVHVHLPQCLQKSGRGHARGVPHGWQRLPESIPAVLKKTARH